MSTVKYERITEAEDLVAWAREHDATPAARELPDGNTELTFNTDGNRDGKPIDWNSFLTQFRSDGLALLVEPDDSRSHYFKIIQESNEAVAQEMGMTRSSQLSKQDQNEDFRAK